jgi:hypothetical protein
MSEIKSSEVGLKRGILNGQSGTYLNGRLVVQSNGVVRMSSLYTKKRKKKS